MHLDRPTGSTPLRVRLFRLGALLCLSGLTIAGFGCTRAETVKKESTQTEPAQKESTQDEAASSPAAGATAAQASPAPEAAKDTAGTGANPQEASAAAAGATQAPGYTQAELDATVSEECRPTLEKIVTLYKRVPSTFGHVGRKVDEILADMEECSQLSRRFMEECPGPMADAWVGQILARFLLAGSQNYGYGLVKGGMSPEEARVKVRERLAEARDLTELAISMNRVGEPNHVRAMRLLVDLTSQSATAEETQKAVERMLADYPNYGDKGGVYFLVGQTYIQEMKYEAAVKFLDAVIEKHESDPDYPLLVLKLFEALTGAGDLKRLEELQHIIRSEYTRRMSEFKGQPLIQARQALDTSAFWLGFVKYAQGDTSTALDYFLESKEYLEKKLADAKAAQQRVDPVLQIFLDYRTRDYIKFINEFHGRVPELDLDLGDMWVTENKLTLEESRGNVVILLSREPGNRRTELFLQEMDTLVKEKSDEGLRGVVVAYLAGTVTPERREDLHRMMLDDHAALGVTLPAGYDPDTTSQSFLRGIHATIGPSATFLVFNRRGELAWYHADPRPMDIQLAKRVVLRILEEE